MKTQLTNLINNGDFESAASLLSEILEKEPMDDTLAILAATIQFYFGNEDEARLCIETGLSYNPYNYELYLMLGNYYMNHNTKLAYLCYENAEFYCEKMQGVDSPDYEYIHDIFETCPEKVPPVSFVILSFNTLDYTKQCIDSIRANCKLGCYELVIIDNASTDGSVEWLEQQEDIILLKNTENKGFAGGCNQGIALSTPENDIFLLNNDTIMMPNALYNLRMDLYASEKHGSAGSCTNNAGNNQTIKDQFETVTEYYEYAVSHNLPFLDQIERKSWLIGFAMLIKRSVLNKIHGLDTIYGIGNFEDNDLGLQIIDAGYQNVLCWNSFIYHWGHKSFDRQKIDLQELLNKNRQIFIDKWGFNPTYYSNARDNLIDFIAAEDKYKEMNILDIGCGLGSCMSHIKYLFPYSNICGIELEPEIARLGSVSNDIICGNIEEITLPYDKESFDYIVMSDVIQQFVSPSKVLQKLYPYLKQQGSLLLLFPNAMNAQVVYDLHHGNTKEDLTGIRDYHNLHYFSLNDMTTLLQQTGYQISRVKRTITEDFATNAHKDFFDQLLANESPSAKEQYDAHYYLIKANKTTGVVS